jgi:hypothetical protein
MASTINKITIVWDCNLRSHKSFIVQATDLRFNKKRFLVFADSITGTTGSAQ